MKKYKQISEFYLYLRPTLDERTSSVFFFFWELCGWFRQEYDDLWRPCFPKKKDEPHGTNVMISPKS